jgi:hypothetical protein
MKNSLKNQPILAFVHIEKAAGTTLIHILRRNFLFRYSDVRPLSKKSNGGQEFNSRFTANDLKKTLIINPFLSCVAGHAIKPYGDLIENFPGIRFITLLREPTKRYLSHYQYWLEKMGRNVRFEDFLKINDISNFQVRKISGSEDISQAKEVLRDRFFHVGIVEKFDEFLVLLKRKLAPTQFEPWYQIKNKAVNKDAGDQILAKYYDEIVERNSVDIQLYEYVKAHILPDYHRWYGDQLLTDLEVFREQNELRFSAMLKNYLDYGLRKFYFEPVGGVIRLSNGLPAKGSY